MTRAKDAMVTTNTEHLSGPPDDETTNHLPVVPCELPAGVDSDSLDAELSAVYVGTVTLDQIVSIRHQIRQYKNDTSKRESLIHRLGDLSHKYLNEGSVHV